MTEKKRYRKLAISFLAAFSIHAQADTRGIDLEFAAENNPTAAFETTYRALFIGNNDYRDPQMRWQPLRTAISDANVLAALLREYYGFSDVTVLHNATRKDTLRALEALLDRIEPGDSVLVYYAGHGYLDSQTEKGFWIPVDAVGEDNTTYLRNSTIRDELVSIANRALHTLLISDSCFSGTLLRSASRSIRPSTNIERYYEKVAQKKSVQIITAGGVEYVDDNYKNSGHSPFSYFLINELKHNNSPMITASELSFNVERAVANNVEQVPESGVLQGAGDELGEFIFFRFKLEVEGRAKIRVNPAQIEKDVPKPRPMPLPTL